MSSIWSARRLKVGDFNQEVQFSVRFTLIQCVVHFSFDMNFNLQSWNSLYMATLALFFCVSTHFTSNHHRPFFSCFGLLHLLREKSPSLARTFFYATFTSSSLTLPAIVPQCRRGKEHQLYHVFFIKSYKYIDRCSFSLFTSSASV